jgi:hypothetical protein
MSHPALNRLMRGGGLTDFHIGRSGSAAHAGNPHVMFAGERYVHLASAMKYDKSGKGGKAEAKNDFSKKEHREKGGKRGREDGSTTGDNSSSDDEQSGGKPMARKKKGSPIHAKGSDADVIALHCSNTPFLSLSDPCAVPHALFLMRCSSQGDGKKGEGKGPKGKGFWSDKNRNGKPDGIEKKK